jgi:hypothetical protein
VPETTPVEEFRVRPVGSAGLTVKVGDPVNLVTVYEAVSVIATLSVPETICTSGDRTGPLADVMVMLNENA